MNIIYLSINYTDKQTSPSVLPVFWGRARKPLFSQRLSAVFKRYLLLVLFLPPSLRGPHALFIQETPTALGPPAPVGQTSECPRQSLPGLSAGTRSRCELLSLIVFPVPWLGVRRPKPAGY